MKCIARAVEGVIDWSPTIIQIPDSPPLVRASSDSKQVVHWLLWTWLSVYSASRAPACPSFSAHLSNHQTSPIQRTVLVRTAWADGSQKAKASRGGQKDGGRKTRTIRVAGVDDVKPTAGLELTVSPVSGVIFPQPSEIHHTWDAEVDAASTCLGAPSFCQHNKTFVQYRTSFALSCTTARTYHRFTSPTINPALKAPS